MTATLTPSLVGTPTRARQAYKPVLRAGALSGLGAATATTAVAVAAMALDVPMKAAPRTADVGREIPLNGYPISTLMCTAVGTVLAVALLRWAKRPAPVFVVTTVVLTVASFAGPITTGHATTATRLVLGLTHVVAAAVVIPVLARRLAHPTPREQ